MNLRRRHRGFQKFKRRPHAAVEHLARHFIELRFRIMQVIDVNRFHAQVAAAAFQLVGQKVGRHRVATTGNIPFAQDARGYVLAIEIFAGIGGHVAIGRQKSALGADQYFFSREAAPRQFGERRPHRTF